MAREQQVPAAMVAALREIGKLMGYYAPRQVRVDLSEEQQVLVTRYEQMSDAELLDVIARSNGAV